MSLYKEKREKLIEKIKFYENRIAKDTEKKKKLLDKLKELTVVSLASELNCKPYELDEVIVKEHELIQRIRETGMSDEEILKMAEYNSTDNSDSDEEEEYNFYDSEDKNAENMVGLL